MEDSVKTIKLGLNLKRISTSSQVISAYYTIKDMEISKGKIIREWLVKEAENDTSILSPTVSNIVAPINHNQLYVINGAFKNDLTALYNEYSSIENHDKRKFYHATFSYQEKLHIKCEWKEKMYALQKHIFFYFIGNDYVLLKKKTRQLLGLAIHLWRQ